jgi:hypothetical protein
MVSKEPRWAMSDPAVFPQSKTEELKKMERKPHIRKTQTVRRTFEPARLSASWLAQAYEMIVSQKVRVINIYPDRTERSSEINVPERRVK